MSVWTKRLCSFLMESPCRFTSALTQYSINTWYSGLTDCGGSTHLPADKRTGVWTGKCSAWLFPGPGKCRQNTIFQLGTRLPRVPAGSNSVESSSELHWEQNSYSLPLWRSLPSPPRAQLSPAHSPVPRPSKAATVSPLLRLRLRRSLEAALGSSVC